MKSSFHCFLVIFNFLALCFHSKAQSICYEQLPDLPFVQIEDVFIAPYGGIFLQSYKNIYKSIDQGQSWEMIRGLPDNFKAHDIIFMQDGSAVLIDPRFTQKALIFRDGAWRDVIEDRTFFYVNDDPYTINGNTLFYQNEDTLVKTEDKGISFTKKPLTVFGEVIKMMSDDDRLYIYNRNDSLLIFDYYIDIYDHDLNFIERHPITFGTYSFRTEQTVKNEDSKIVFLDWIDDILYFTSDGSQTFSKRNLNNLSTDNWGISNGRVYFEEDGLTFSLPLDENFETEIPKQENFAGESKFFNVQNNHLISGSKLDFETKNTTTEAINTFRDFPFSDLRLHDIKVNKQGHIFASTLFNESILRSKDDGSTWQEIQGTTFFNLNEDGSYTTLIISGREKTIISVDGNNNIIDTWDDLETYFYNRDFAFHLNDGEYRFYIQNGNCLDVGTAFQVSKDGRPFEVFNTGEVKNCFPTYPEVVHFGDKVYLFDSNYSSLYISIDLSDNYKVERKNIANSDSYSSVVKEDGRIYGFVRNGFSLDTSNQFFSTFYSDDVRNDVEPVGRGPRGTLLHGEALEETFIITRTCDHFYRKNVLENFVKIEVKDKPFDNFRAGVIDNEGRILVISADEKIYRTTEIDLSTSTEEISNQTAALYPNPVSDVLNVEIDGLNNGYISIFDTHGKLMFNEFLSDSNLQIDMSEFAVGLYILEIINQENVKSVHKFFKN